MMRVRDINLNDILLWEKPYQTILKYLIDEISYKTFMNSIPLCIRFGEIDGFIKIYDGFR